MKNLKKILICLSLLYSSNFVFAMENYNPTTKGDNQPNNAPPVVNSQNINKKPYDLEQEKINEEDTKIDGYFQINNTGKYDNVYPNNEPAYVNYFKKIDPDSENNNEKRRYIFQEQHEYRLDGAKEDLQYDIAKTCFLKKKKKKNYTT